MVEVVAENYHNIWAKKKKSELETKGEPTSLHLLRKGTQSSHVLPGLQKKR
jgi:hypothetical protein